MKRHFLKLLIPFLLGLGIVFSFTREMVIAYYYGSSKEVEIYRIAIAIPYALFQSLGSILVASLLPILIKEGDWILREIQKIVKSIFFLLSFLAILTVSWQAEILAPGFESESLKLLSLNLAICWAILFFATLIFPLRLSLQKNDKKYLVSSTSLLFSLFFIVFIILLHNSFPSIELSLVSVISIALIYIIYRINNLNIIQKSSKVQQNITLNKYIYKIIIASFVYIFLLTIPRLIDKGFASEIENGVIANLDYAMNFYVAFGVLIGTSFNIIFAKDIASNYREKSTNIKWLLKLVGLPFILAVIISSVLLPFSEQLVTLAYYRGAFTTYDITQVTKILQWFLITLPFMVAGMMLSQIIAAHSIFILISIITVKICSKYIWLKFAFYKNNLEMFGQSTLIMEILGIGIILFFMHNYKIPKAIK